MGKILRKHKIESPCPYLGHTVDEVSDVRANGPDSGEFFPLAEPFLNTNGFLIRHTNVKSQMLETLDQLATGSLDCDDPGLDCYVHSFGYCHRLICVDNFHPKEKSRRLFNTDKGFLRDLAFKAINLLLSKDHDEVDF